MFWVSRLGSDAVAVVGITESVMTIIYAVAIGISMAATAIVSRRIGEKDPERASHAAGQIVLLGIGVASGLGLVMLYQLWHLTGHHSRLHVGLRHLRPEREVLTGVLRTSGSGIAQLMISTTSWLGLFKILSPFGTAAIAGYTIAIRVVIFALMPAWGLANAGATLVGQNLGAEKPERAASAVWIALRYNVIFLGITGLLFVAFAGPIVSLFAPDAEVFAYGKQALWIISLAFPLYAAGMCLEGAFNGAGDTWTPTYLNFFCLWLFQVPLAWFLAHTCQLGPTGVFIAVTAAFGSLALWSAVLFKKGRWKLKKV